MNANDIKYSDPIVRRYLDSNPLAAQALVNAALLAEGRRARKQAAWRRWNECSGAKHDLAGAVAAARNAVNQLRGRLLTLQKEHKRACQAEAQARAEFEAMG